MTRHLRHHGLRGALPAALSILLGCSGPVGQSPAVTAGSGDSQCGRPLTSLDSDATLVRNVRLRRNDEGHEALISEVSDPVNAKYLLFGRNRLVPDAGIELSTGFSWCGAIQVVRPGEATVLVDQGAAEGCLAELQVGPLSHWSRPPAIEVKDISSWRAKRLWHTWLLVDADRDGLSDVEVRYRCCDDGHTFEQETLFRRGREQVVGARHLNTNDIVCSGR